MSSVAPHLSSAPPSSVTGSTIEDPDLAGSDGDQTPVLDRSSPQAQSSPVSRIDTDSNHADKARGKSKMPRQPQTGPSQESFAWGHEGPEEANTEDEQDEMLIIEADSKRSVWEHRESRSPSARQSTAATTVGTRRKGDGTIGSVYSGNKIRHLKKDDGVPLWRTDIQYEFLRLVFEDRSPYFTRFSDEQEGCNFADVYIDAMARSSKTSKVLKDKLTSDRTAAQNMAMICLLVNVGRMNTTLNFFPEMKAQLRTYHSIPSLQAHRDQNTYKQLQDAPRLKSILKGATEDTNEPRTIENIKALPIPRTNPVNLIFVLSQYAPKISEIHFFPPRDFFDLVMRPTISSQSRAMAFLWLMWWYLQSDFSEEAALNNPFGSGLYAPNDQIPVKVPNFEELTEEQGAAENIDPPDEVAFGEEKQQERKHLLEMDEPDNKVLKRVKKSGAGDEILSDYESRASVPRATSPAMRDSLGFTVLNPAHQADPATSRLGGQADSLEDDWEPVNPHPGRGRYKRVKKDRDSATNAPLPTSSSGRVLQKTSKAQNPGLHDPGTPDSMQAQPPGAAHPILHQFDQCGHGLEGANRTQPQPNNTSTANANASATTPATATATATSTSHRRPRPLTQHQLAVEANRRHLTETLLAVKKKEIFDALRRKRERSNFILRAACRIQNLPMGYDSEDESTSWGMGGLGPNPDSTEEDDFGEEAEVWLRVVEKVKRRLERGTGGGGGGIGGGSHLLRLRDPEITVDSNLNNSNKSNKSNKKNSHNNNNSNSNSTTKPTKPSIGKKKPKKRPQKKKPVPKWDEGPNDIPNDDGDRDVDTMTTTAAAIQRIHPAEGVDGGDGGGGGGSGGGDVVRATTINPAATAASPSRLDDIDKSLLAEKTDDDVGVGVDVDVDVNMNDYSSVSAGPEEDGGRGGRVGGPEEGGGGD